jgi:hypothetical protein
MVQRLGRVNRRGAGEADVWIIPAEPDSKTTEALEKHAKLRDASDAEDEASEEADGADEADADSDAVSDEDEGGAPKRLKDEERARVERWHRRQATLQAIASLRPVEAAFDGSPRAISSLKQRTRSSSRRHPRQRRSIRR